MPTLGTGPPLVTRGIFSSSERQRQVAAGRAGAVCSGEQAASSTQRTCDSSRRQRAASRQQQWHPASASTCCGDRHQRATNEQAAHLPPPGKVANRGQRAASEPRAAAASSSNRPSTPSDFCHTSRKSKAFICFILLERTCPKTTKQRDLQESEILSRRILRADQDEICVVKMDWCFFFSERKIKIGRPQRLAKKVLYHARFAYYFCTASITKDSPTLFLPRLPTRLISGFQFLRVMSVRHTSKPESNLTPFIMR